MEIHRDSNGVTVTALSGKDKGHAYDIHAGDTTHPVQFQKGGVADNGVNGVTNEALLAIVIHRLEFLQGRFPCIQNSLAIINAKAALDILEQRTRSRIEREAEGKEVA